LEAFGTRVVVKKKKAGRPGLITTTSWREKKLNEGKRKMEGEKLPGMSSQGVVQTHNTKKTGGQIINWPRRLKTVKGDLKAGNRCQTIQD